MRFAWLGSGSRGNAAVFEHGSTRLLVDCGFSARDTTRRLAQLEVEPDSLDAVLVTHEHSDHVRGLTRFADRHDLPVWLTPGTFAALQPEAPASIEVFSPHEPFALRDFEIHPFPVPHDAREPVQFVFSDGARGIGVLTDLGRMTPHAAQAAADCDALILECNHDPRLLAEGRYPPSLKRRISGAMGHLSNEQAAGFLAGMDTSALQHIVAAHLSESNNTPELARAAVADTLGCREHWVAVADQETGLTWREITTR